MPVTRIGVIGSVYQYDPSGNTLSDGLHSYRYDAKNQLLEVVGVASYVYNGLGQRIAKNSNAVLTHYVYDETDRLIGEYDAAGQSIQETVYLFGQPVAVLKGTEIYNVHTDHLGSPRKITNQAGNTVWQWLEKPFGDAPVNQDPDGDGIAFDYNLRFPGQYFDKETGLSYNYHRYYDPQTGRYITSDPIGLGGGLNTYGYVGNNPVNAIDPIGLVKWKGEVYAVSVIDSIGAGVYHFDLKSECVNGKYAYISVNAGAGMLGFGYRLTGGGSSISFDDHLSDIDPYGFEGGFGVTTAGIGWGLTGGYSFYKLGSNYSDFSTTLSPSIGYDMSFGGGLGVSHVSNVEWKGCECD